MLISCYTEGQILLLLLLLLLLQGRIMLLFAIRRDGIYCSFTSVKFFQEIPNFGPQHLLPYHILSLGSDLITHTWSRNGEGSRARKADKKTPKKQECCENTINNSSQSAKNTFKLNPAYILCCIGMLHLISVLFWAVDESGRILLSHDL